MSERMYKVLRRPGVRDWGNGRVAAGLGVGKPAGYTVGVYGRVTKVRMRVIFDAHYNIEGEWAESEPVMYRLFCPMTVDSLR